MRWRWWRRRAHWETRMDAEMRFHLESQIAEYRRQGLSEAEAERRARVEFGAVELAKDECRDERRSAWLEVLLQDLRYAVRCLAKSPGFTLSALLTLTLSIGANTALFQLLNAVRLRSLPVPNPGELRTVRLADDKGWRGSQASMYPALTNPIWEKLRDTQDAFAGMAAWGDSGFNLSPGGETRLARGIFVNGEFFRTLGVRPYMGRLFTATDDRPGCGLPGAVISYAFWQRELGGKPGAIGSKLTLNYRQVDVIGMTPPEFHGLEIGRSYDVAVPICSQAALWNEGDWLNAGTVWWLNVMGRLRPGGSAAEANQHLQALSPALFQAVLPANYPKDNVPDFLRFRLHSVPAESGLSAMRERYADPLLILLGASGLVLLIACANLANLYLARATARTHELAVRLAIGASRGRLIRQFLVESGVLSIAGAVGGTLLAGLLSAFLVSLLGAPGDPLFLDLRTDWRMLAFTAGAAGLTCVLFGLMPALRATRIAAADAMKAGGRATSAARGKIDVRQGLVALQVALSLMLLVSALLLSGTLRNLMNVDSGFRPDGVLIVSLDLSRTGVAKTQRYAFKRDLLERMRAIPGVQAAAGVSMLPLSGEATSNSVWVEDRGPGEKVGALFNWTGPGYLETMGIRLLAGRDFADRDAVSGSPVAIVNRTFAQRLKLPANPVGSRFRREATPSSPEVVYEIVGLADDTKYSNLRESSKPIAFLGMDRDNGADPFPRFVVRAKRGQALPADLRGMLSQANSAMGMEFVWYADVVRGGLLRERLMASLSGFFGLLAILISAVGLYGVISYLVVRRTAEIGVRIALGAASAGIVLMILRHAGKLLAIGLAAGALLSVPLAWTIRSTLFGLKPYDAATLITACGVLAIVTVAASYVPARRAARLQPMAALREE